MISVVISIYNSEEHIKRCFDSVLNSKGVKVEIIAVVNSYTIKSKEILDKFLGRKEVNIIYLNKNRGRVYATNLGIKKAKSKIVMILDVDTKLFPRTIYLMSNKIKADKSIAVVAPLLLKGDSDKLDSTDHFISPIGLPYEMGIGETVKKNSVEKEIFAAKNCGLMVRKDVFNKVGKFDPDMYMHGEETDLCWRIHLAGHRIVYFPTAKMRHYGKSSLNSGTRVFIYTEGIKNNFSYLLKNISWGRLIVTLPLFLSFWSLMLIQSVVSLDFRKVVWIVRGLFGGMMQIRKTLQKRKRIYALTSPESVANTNKILGGNLSRFELLEKGWRWISNG